MARIPLQIAERRLDTGNVVQYPSGSPIGAALEGFGDSLSQAAETVRIKDERKDAFTADIVDNEFRSAMAGAEAEAERGAAADGSGLHDGVYGQMLPDGGVAKPGSFDKLFDDYLSRMPASQREQFAAKREAYRMQGSNRLATTQYNREQAWYKVEIQKAQNDIVNSIGLTAPDDQTFEQFRQQGVDLIRKSGLPALEKDVAEANWLAQADETLFTARLERDPEFAKNARAALGLGSASGRVTSGSTEEGAAALLRKFEGFRSSTYWDVNAHRLGYGSDTITKADGSIVRVQQGMTVTRADAERDLARRAREFANTAAGQVGRQAWQHLSPNARAALTSVAYNYGSLPDSVVRAVQTGDTGKVASAVAGLAGHNNGVNAKRRREEAAVIRGGEISNAGAADDIYSNIPLDRRLILANKADQANARNVAAYGDALKDYLAYLRDGNDPDATGQFAGPQLAINLPPEAAASAQSQIDAARAYGNDKSALAFAGPAEVQEIIARRSSALESPEGYQDNAKDLGGLATVLEQRNKQIAADPAAYVIQQPGIRAAYEAVQAAPQDAGAARAYATATLAEQSRLGVPQGIQRILPEPMAANIVAGFNDQSQGAQNAAVLMRGLEQTWGSNWPRVFGELAATKQLPGTALVVGAMNRPTQARAAEALAQAAKIGTSELEKAVTGTTKKDVDTAVDDAMTEFGGTLASNGASGVSTFLTFREGVYQLALSYARSESPSEAASRAYSDVIGKAYSINETYRVPIEFDADQVARNGESILSRLTGEGLVLPASGLNEEQTRGAYVQQLRANGYWVTNGDETGLTLFDETGAAVLKKDGTPLGFTWAELTAEHGGSIPSEPATPMLSKPWQSTFEERTPETGAGPSLDESGNPMEFRQ